MKQLLKEWKQFLNENEAQAPDIKKLEQAYVQGLKNKSNTQAGGALQKLTKLAKMGKYNIDNLKKLKSSIKEVEYDTDTIRKMVEEEIEKLNEKPAKGKKSSKTYINPETGRKNKRSYGQKGARISPGTSKGDSYCARSFGIKKGLSKKKQNDPNTANNLSRKKWKCKGAKSSK